MQVTMSQNADSNPPQSYLTSPLGVIPLEYWQSFGMPRN